MSLTASVYLVHDTDGCVLYVGMSTGPITRMESHRRKEWGPQIAFMTIVGTFPWSLAEQIEHDTILAIQPPHNVASKNGLRAWEMARLQREAVA